MLKRILGNVAPFLGALIGGPFGFAAVRAIGGLLLNKDNATENEILKALRFLTPDQESKLKKMDHEYKMKMAEVSLGKFKVEVSDRDSAREREIKLKDKMPAVLSVCVTIGFFGVLILLIFFPIPLHIQSIVNVLLGALGTAWISCISYYFGTSRSSLFKTELLAGMKNEKK